MADNERTSMQAMAEMALAAAKKAGASQAAAQVSQSNFVEAGFRDGSLEKASASSKQGLTLRLFVDSRYGVHSTSDLRPQALEEFVPKAAKLTALLEPDTLRRLPQPGQYPQPPSPDLEIYDPALGQTEPQHWVDRAQALDGFANQAAVQARQLVSSQGSSYMEVSRELLATSNGFLGLTEETGCYHLAGVVLMDSSQPGKRRSGYWYQGSRNLAGLDGEKAMEVVALEAVRRALRQMGARPGPTGRATVVLENLAAGRLMSDLLGALSGPALRQGRSYLAGKLGSQATAKIFTVEDQPLLPAGFGSRWFDNEGLAARPFMVIEQGVLRNYYLDTYYARALEMQPTTGAASNLEIKPSQPGGFQEMIKDLERGLAITGFLGGNFNSTTGDFSYGLTGLWVEGGQVAHPVEGMNMAGNFADLWQGLSRVGDDHFPYSRLRTPSLRFEDVMLAGG